MFYHVKVDKTLFSNTTLIYKHLEKYLTSVQARRRCFISVKRKKKLLRLFGHLHPPPYLTLSVFNFIGGGALARARATPEILPPVFGQEFYVEKMEH